MTHTKEPWRLYQKPSSIIISDDLPDLLCSTFTTSLSAEEMSANAKRIVACVNACAGITNEALEENIIKHAMADFMQDSNHFGETPVFYDLPLMTDADEGRKVNIFQEYGERDYPEHRDLENGNYYNTCSECGLQFIGHKRMTVCKLCGEGRKG